MRKVKDAKNKNTGDLFYFRGHAQATYMSDGSTVEDVINQVIGGNTEKLVVTVSGVSEDYTIYVMDENDNVIDSQTTSFKTYRIPAGTKYYVKGSEIRGYYPNTTELRTAFAYAYNEVTIEYKNKITTIRINQNISDPSTMITRIVDNGGIEAIRANSHRYTGTFNSLTGVMTLKQLDDNDGTVYLDGSEATLTTIGTDVWMKLPQFYWKCEEYDTNIWDFSVCYGVKPDNTWKDWDGKDLIGAYEAAKTYDSNSLSYKILSISDYSHSTGSTMEEFKTWVRNRGNGFSLVKWKHHCMMAMLFYTQYLTTDVNSICGNGGSAYDNTGRTNKLGMADTSKDIGDSDYVNFWGLENWWGKYGEYIDNVLDMQITEDDNSIRNFPSSIAYDTICYPLKLYFGENIDLLPMDTAGSLTTGFCSYMSVSTIGYLTRDKGVVGLQSRDPDSTSQNIGTRLAFRGEIVIES